MGIEKIEKRVMDKLSGKFGEIFDANKVIDAALSPLELAGRLVKGEGMNSFGSTFGRAAEGGTERAFSNGVDVGRVAGAYMGGATAYRVASGGGLYKDKNGNTNVIGMPFI